MTPLQLELKRLRELAAGARKARHLVHAMRTPLARLVRFERAALEAWNKPLEKLSRLKPNHGFEAADPDDYRDRIAHLANLADALGKDEARVKARIDKLAASKKLTTSKPIEQRIKGRRKAKLKAGAKREAAARAHGQWEARVRASAERFLGKGPDERSVRWLEQISADASKNTAMARSAMRQYGDGDIADDMLAIAKAEPKP